MGGRGSAGIGQAETWSVARVGRLASGNEPGMTVAQEYAMKEGRGRYSPNDHARAAQYRQTPREYQAEITADIGKNGMINAVQWDREDRMLTEGYHRYAAMRQLGIKTMRIRRAS